MLQGVLCFYTKGFDMRIGSLLQKLITVFSSWSNNVTMETVIREKRTEEFDGHHDVLGIY